MKEIHEVLRDKERDLTRVRNEVDSLRLVATLLSEGVAHDRNKKTGPAEEMFNREAELEATGTDALFSSMRDSRPGFWKALGWRK